MCTITKYCVNIKIITYIKKYIISENHVLLYLTYYPTQLVISDHHMRKELTHTELP